MNVFSARRILNVPVGVGFTAQSSTCVTGAVRTVEREKARGQFRVGDTAANTGIFLAEDYFFAFARPAGTKGLHLDDFAPVAGSRLDGISQTLFYSFPHHEAIDHQIDNVGSVFL